MNLFGKTDIETTHSKANTIKEALPTTAFGELRTATLNPVLQNVFTYGVNTRFFDKTETNGGVVSSANSMAVLTTSASGNSTAGITSIERAKYRSGQGLVARFSAMFPSKSAADAFNCDIGIGTTDDNLCFRQSNIGAAVVRTVGGVENIIYQSAWNVDRCNDTGNIPTINFQKLNVFEIVVQYLGSGQITFKIENPNTGRMETVHAIRYGSTATTPSLDQAAFALYAKAYSSSLESVVFKSASMFLAVEGQIDRTIALYNSYDNKKNIGGTETNIFTIRNRATFNSKTNYNIIYFENLSISNTDTKIAIVRVSLNTTLGGTPSYSNYDTNTSIAEVDTAGTTRTGGNIVLTYLLGGSASAYIDLSHYNLKIGPSKTLTVSANLISGSAADIYASLQWAEDQI